MSYTPSSQPPPPGKYVIGRDERGKAYVVRTYETTVNHFGERKDVLKWMDRCGDFPYEFIVEWTPIPE